MAQKTKRKQRNLEELRCLAMMMVVVLHFLGKGDLLGDVTTETMPATQVAAWILEAFCIVAVNCYMLISGYFLWESSFKCSRLLKLYAQVWVYSVGVGLAAVALGVVPAADLNTHYYLTLLFPWAMGHYWFMTAYLFFYMLLPLVGSAVKRMEREKLKLVSIIVLVICTLEKTILPFRLEEDGQGYNFLWYLCVFLVAAYIGRYGVHFLQSAWHCVLLYLGGCGLILAELFVCRQIYLQTGSLGLILKVSFEYNHLFVLLASVGLFGMFLHLKGTGVVGRLAEAMAPYVLGVYLLHENIGVRYVWQRIFGVEQIHSVAQLLLRTASAVLSVFAVGILVDWLRSILAGIFARILAKTKAGQRWEALLTQADAVMEES
ncbi:MAG: acyltransferase [Lachnospiraceae bacterium]|nr:acyltransferase [Lachnospiraceae bacterium]